MGKLLLSTMNVKNKKVLMRVDFNVPLSKEGMITDDTRIIESLPSIHYVLNQGGSLILMSHLGRPSGKKDPKYSLAPCAKRLEELLKVPVYFARDCIGKEVEALAKNLKPKEVLLLENVRFYPEEEEPALNPSFAKEIASLGDMYVNDGFGVSHRSHSSVTEIAKYFPKASAAGFLIEKELKNLGLLLKNPPRPFYAIIGGSKISSKIKVLKALIEKVDALFIGGGMSYTFLKSQGYSIGDSICEKEQLSTAAELVAECKKRGVALYLPLDIVTAKEYANDSPQKIFEVSPGIEAGWQGLDIGPKTLKEWSSLLKQAKTLFWNGPVGVFEFPNFAQGTKGIAKTLAECQALTIIGGGDSVAAIQSFGLSKSFTHLSTGGGASLEFIENGQLPGIEALSDA